MGNSKGKEKGQFDEDLERKWKKPTFAQYSDSENKKNLEKQLEKNNEQYIRNTMQSFEKKAKKIENDAKQQIQSRPNPNSPRKTNIVHFQDDFENIKNQISDFIGEAVIDQTSYSQTPINLGEAGVKTLQYEAIKEDEKIKNLPNIPESKESNENGLTKPLKLGDPSKKAEEIPKTTVDAQKEEEAVEGPGGVIYQGKFKGPKHKLTGHGMIYYHGKLSGITTPAQEPINPQSATEKENLHLHSYKGDWMQGMRHGEGFLLYSDGSYYQGGFFLNHRQGKGHVTDINQKKFSGVWAYGKLRFLTETAVTS